MELRKDLLCGDHIVLFADSEHITADIRVVAVSKAAAGENSAEHSHVGRSARKSIFQLVNGRSHIFRTFHSTLDLQRIHADLSEFASLWDKRKILE